MEYSSRHMQILEKVFLSYLDKNDSDEETRDLFLQIKSTNEYYKNRR
jgi:hypothetical protein